MTYLLLNLTFTAIAVVLFIIIRPSIGPKPLALAGLSLLMMTALGDNFIVGVGIVDYDSTKILGIQIGVAPVEDFFYAVIAVLLIPAIWEATGSLSKNIASQAKLPIDDNSVKDAK
ncbi:MAG: lycopene cyclase domain-containing protein [Microbacteriaceae bacterium]